LSRGRRRGLLGWVRESPSAGLLLLFLLCGCGSVGLPREDAPAPAAAAGVAYADAIAQYVRAGIKDAASGDSFELSELRWVHSMDGWVWLACVRYRDHGHRRTYAVFLKDNKVISARLAVETDGCNAQNYFPFAQMPSAPSPPPASNVLAPLY
jgi:hypothetical protein